MTNTIKIKRNGTASQTPTSLEYGELAINYADGKIFYKNSSDAIVEFSGSGASLTISDTAPVSPSAGDLWYESDTGKTFLYYDSFWVEIGSNSSGAIVLGGLNDVVLTSPTNGQVLKYDGTNWVNGIDDAGTTITSLDDIGDVDVATPSYDSFLRWNGSAWIDDDIVSNGIAIRDIRIGLDTATSIKSATRDLFISSSDGVGNSFESGIYIIPGHTTSNTSSTGHAALLRAGYNINTTGSGTSVGGTTFVQGGSSEGGATSTGGNVRVDGGTGQTTNGSVLIGTSIAEAVTIGRNGKITTVAGNLSVTGNLTVNGTTTTINTETLLVEDNIITLNSNALSPTTNAGIEVYRGPGEFSPALQWNEISDKWEITTDGTNYDTIQTETPFNELQQKVKNQMMYLICEVNP